MTDQNLAPSMLLPAPTSTIYTFWDVKKSESKTAREEGIVDAPRQVCWRNSRKPCFSPQICSAFGACPCWGRGTDPVYQPCTAEDCVLSSSAWSYAISFKYNSYAKRDVVLQKNKCNSFRFDPAWPTWILTSYSFCSTSSVSAPGPVCCHLVMFPENFPETKRCWWDNWHRLSQAVVFHTLSLEGTAWAVGLGGFIQPGNDISSKQVHTPFTPYPQHMPGSKIIS